MNVVTEMRPRSVTVAVALLVIMAIVGSISGFFIFGHSQLARSAYQELPFLRIVQYGSLAFGLALNLFLAIMMFFRHNWARIAVAVLFIAGFVLALPGYLGAFHVPMQTKMFGVNSYLVQLVAIVLLFTGKGGLWFKRSAL